MQSLALRGQGLDGGRLALVARASWGRRESGSEAALGAEVENRDIEMSARNKSVLTLSSIFPLVAALPDVTADYMALRVDCAVVERVVHGPTESGRERE